MDSKIAQLYCSDTLVSSFHPDSTNFTIEIPEDVKKVPELKAITSNAEVKSTIYYSPGLPGYATINVASKYNASYTSYKVHFKYEESNVTFLPKTETERYAITVATHLTHFLNAQIVMGKPGQATIRLLNLQGQLIRQEKIMFNRGKNNYTLNTSELSSGIYIYDFTFSDGMKYTGKAVKS